MEKPRKKVSRKRLRGVTLWLEMGMDRLREEGQGIRVGLTGEERETLKEEGKRRGVGLRFDRDLEAPVVYRVVRCPVRVAPWKRKQEELGVETASPGPRWVGLWETMGLQALEVGEEGMLVEVPESYGLENAAPRVQKAKLRRVMASIKAAAKYRNVGVKVWQTTGKIGLLHVVRTR